MIKQNQKIITNHLNKQEDKKLEALKELLNTPAEELFDNKEFNFSDAGLKYQVRNRTDIDVSKEELIQNSYKIFSSFYHDVPLDEFHEFKDSLFTLPLETFPIIHSFEDMYFDYGIYNIFHFIKNTKYILKNLEKKQRYFYSTYNSKVLQSNIKQMEQLKTNKFLYPKSKFEQELIEGKEHILSLANENYNMLFAWNSFSADLNIMDMFKDSMIDAVFNDFLDELNAIRTTKKDAIKSLAILLFRLYDAKFDTQDNELFVENMLRACFNDEILEINQNKKNMKMLDKDTFKVTTKEYRKNVYIYSVFDGIKIYGINDENKYFYFYKMTPKEIMGMYFSLMQKVNPFAPKLSKVFYKYIKEQFKHPYRSSYNKQYPEFFEKENPNILDLMATFFQQMKKTAPDNLK